MSKMRDYIFLFLIVDSDVYVRLLKSDYKIALIISFHQWFYRFPHHPIQWYVRGKCRNWDIVLTSRMVSLLILKKESWSFVVPKGSFNILFYSKCICSKNVFFAWMFKKSHDLKMICFWFSVTLFRLDINQL
jgi:hypothetical protein